MNFMDLQRAILGRLNHFGCAIGLAPIDRPLGKGLIAPDRPGALQTKWIARIEVL